VYCVYALVLFKQYCIIVLATFGIVVPANPHN